MKKLWFAILPIIFLLLACTKKDETVKLEPGTPEYELAAELSTKLEYLDPEKNNVLVSCNYFDITSGELVETLQKTYGSRTEQLRQLQPDRLKNILERNVKDLAERKLLYNAALESSVVLSDSSVDSILNIQMKSAGSEEKYMEFIKKNNLNIEDIRVDIGKQLIIQRYIDSYLGEKTKVTEDDILKAYGEDKTASVKHILLMTQGKSEEEKKEVRAKMEEILAKARAGEDFEKLAKEYSEDPGSKDKGGLYENFGRGQMVKPFEDAAFSVEIGEISDIVETRYGYHIIKVMNRKKETEPLEKIRTQLESRIQNEKRNEAMQTLIDDLKEQANLEFVEFS
jgi:parvulin-like peptidyl-prolyl isomerase